MIDLSQAIQEAEYEFPYHHLPRYENGRFTQMRELYWGYEYFSYIEFVKNLILKQGFENLIDIGCGDGRFVGEISKLTQDKRLVGVDFSERAIGFAKLFFPTVDYRVEKLGIQKYQEIFDIGALIEVIEHIPPKEMDSFAKHVASLIRPSGYLFLTTPTENIPVNRKHFQHFTRVKLESLLKDDFELIETHYLNKNSLFAELIQKLLSNRFFAAKGTLSHVLYKLYTKTSLKATETNAKRICCVFKRRSL